jgi:hypothetical protein
MNILLKFKNFKRLLPYLLLLASFVACIYKIDLAWFNTHMGRDLSRAQDWLNFNFSNWLGPEMGWDYKKLPGPFYYWLLASLKLFNSMTFILIIKTTAVYAVLYFLINEVRKSFGETVTVNFLLLFLFMPVYIFTSRNIWNPSFIILFNCLQFLFFLKFNNTKNSKFLWLIGATAALGMQVHFSTVIIFLASSLAIIVSPNLEKRFKLIQLSQIAFFIVWLLTWYFYNFVPEFNNQLSSFYGSNSYFTQRIFDVSYHLSLNLMEIQDYDLFTLFFKTLSELGLISSSFLIFLTFTLSLFYLLLFTTSLVAILINYLKKRNSFDMFLLLHTIFFLISILVLKNKEHIPYRYGLCFYPIQFFIISYGLFLGLKSRPAILKAFGYLAASTFAFYAYFNYKIIQAQDVTGRSHHTNNDNLELTLKNKKYIYSFLQHNVVLNKDPFNYLHGRSINKFRLKEMNWEQNSPYFSLYKMQTGNNFSYTKDSIHEEIRNNWLVQLKNLEQLKKDPTNSLQITEISTEALPKNLNISYYGINKQLLASQYWKNTSLIMPSAFLKNIGEVDTLDLEFEANSNSYSYLNILIDDNSFYKFAYQNNYEILSVKLNGKPIKPEKKYSGYFLVQNQYIFKLNNTFKSKIVLSLKLNVHFNNYSRIDIFLTKDILPAEEIFIKTEQ